MQYGLEWGAVVVKNLKPGDRDQAAYAAAPAWLSFWGIPAERLRATPNPALKSLGHCQICFEQNVTTILFWQQLPYNSVVPLGEGAHSG